MMYQGQAATAAEVEAKAKLIAELKKWDSGRWRWDKIDCCWTGKDADLEPWVIKVCQSRL